jgi:hypothetical protein
MDQAIFVEEHHLILILFDHDWDETYMQVMTS